VSKKRSFVVVLAFLIILILTVRGVIGVRGSLHGCYVSGGERSKGILIERWVRKRELVEIINAHLLVLTALVAQKHILALTGVPAPGEHALEHPQDITGGGGRGSRDRSG
jgi:hypothetical protein